MEAAKRPELLGSGTAIVRGFAAFGGRVVVSLLILFFVLAGSAPTLLLLFVATELTGAVAEARIR